VYERLAGDLLRDILNQSSDVAEKTFHKFGIFIAQLHDKGVYFRSAHLKNILVLPNKGLGLIDISDMQIKRNSLDMTLRQRNFEHILRYQEDKDLMTQHLDTFTTSYTTASHLNKKDALLIKQTIQTILN
jgi:tRNA A-37 threonylcarbamoyl transferase component Bud32